MRISDWSSDVCSSDLLSAQVLRAGEILGWVRSFVKKRPPQTTALDINALVRETVGLVSYERCNQDFSIELALADSLPSVEADKIEVQQILDRTSTRLNSSQ